MHRSQLMLVLLIFVLPTASHAQIVEGLPKYRSGAGSLEASGDKIEENQFLSNISVDVGDGSAQTRLKIGKVMAKIGSHHYPLYFLTNAAGLIPEGKDSVKFAAKEILSQFGGLLNLALAKEFYWGDEGKKGKDGAIVEVRGGAKLIEFTSGGSDRYTGAGQITASGTWYIPLMNADDLSTQAGLWTIGFHGALHGVGGDRYRDLFKGADGNRPPNVLGSLTVESSFHIYNQFYMSGGYTWSSSKYVPGAGFGGLSLKRG